MFSPSSIILEYLLVFSVLMTVRAHASPREGHRAPLSLPEECIPFGCYSDATSARTLRAATFAHITNVCGDISNLNDVFRSDVLRPPPKETSSTIQYKDLFDDAVDRTSNTLPNQIAFSQGTTAKSVTTACQDAMSMLAKIEFGRECRCNSQDLDGSSMKVNSSAQLTSSSLWTYRNSLFGSTFVQTGIPPAVVNHDGQLFVLYANKSNNNLYYAVGNNDNWGTPNLFVDLEGQPYPVSNAQAPALASLDGSLHAVIQQKASLIHFIFNDTTNVWEWMGEITASYKTPTITGYNGQLFLGALSDSGNKLSFSYWNPESGWSSLTGANGETSWGIPAIYVQNNALYMLFAENNSGRKIQNLIYNNTTQTWSRVSPPPESTAFGVSATFGNEMSFMGFQENANSGNVYVSIYNNSWAPHEDTGHSSSDTPTLAILDDVLNVVFDSRNGNRDILWVQRPLTFYSLESWMSVVDGNRYISSLSLPGTHDSTAVSDTPTVGCQTMSITEQLNAGIRYFDLRSGLVGNVPIMYHNFYPINPPTFLLLSTVIGDMLSWLSSHSTEAIIVQIKQDADPKFSTISFATAIAILIKQNFNSWNIGTTVPTLTALRGKIQLVRRYAVNVTAGELAIGINVTSWPDNSPRFDINTPSGVHLIIQDEYAFDEALASIVTDKFNVLNAVLTEAVNNPNMSDWYISFSSATHVFDADGFWIVPEDIAVGAWDFANWQSVSGVNSRLRNQIYALPSGKRYGTILMDYPESEDDLIARIVAENM